MVPKHILHIVSEDRSRLELRQKIRLIVIIVRTAIAATIALVLTYNAVIQANTTRTLACEPDDNQTRTYTCQLTEYRSGTLHSVSEYTAIVDFDIDRDANSRVILSTDQHSFKLPMRAPNSAEDQFTDARRTNQSLTLAGDETQPWSLIMGLIALLFWYLALRALLLKGSWVIFDNTRGTITYRSEGIWWVKKGQARLEEIADIQIIPRSHTKVGDKVINQILGIYIHLHGKTLPLLLGDIYGKARNLDQTRSQAYEVHQRIIHWLTQTGKSKLLPTAEYAKGPELDDD